MNPRYNIHSTKVHGSRPQGDHGQDQGRSSITTTKKRSLRRAYRRLDTNGYTWYKGRYWQKQIILPTQPDFVPKPADNTSSQPLEHTPKNRLIVFHWNGGALSSARYNELLQWLHFHRVDVAIISETHWSYTSEWQTPHWNAIHSGHGSGQKDKASGLLVLVATKLCRPEQIVWREVEAGRLVHCRLHLHPRSFDIIGVYQHTWNTAVVQKARRKQIWSSMVKLLQEIPQRNSLCILGDFNCSLPMIPRLVGQAHYVTPTGKKLGPQHGDSSTVSQLMNDFQLVALNTWTPTLGATSFTPSGSSRIDYIMVRHRDADTAAKQVGMLSNAPFLHTGAYHIPMITSVNHKYFRPPRQSHLRVPRQVKEYCTQEYRQETVYWQGCEQGINFALRQATDLHTLEDMYRILSQGLMHYFHSGASPASQTCSGFAVQKWSHYAQLCQPGTPDLHTLFHKWKHFSSFHKMEKLHIRWIKTVKRAKIQQLSQEAQQAFEQHDSFRLYHAISRACPRQQIKRIHLKDDAGVFLTPPEETAAYVKYIQDNWSGPTFDVPDLPIPGVPFTVTELEQVIATIPSTKAVAPGFVPGPIWKSQSAFIAEWLMQKLQQWWNQKPPYIPQTWRDAWACWLPKPHKPPVRLENLRMLGLQEPLGKAVLKLVAKKALSQTFRWFGTYPQYAYLPFRSTRDSILRAATHCSAVRQILMNQKRSIYVSTISQPKLHCAGGIMLFLDLRRAFDQVPRSTLVTALQRTQLDPRLQSLIIQWHQQTHYHIEVNNTCRSIPVSRGVRQGCSIAPYLWTAVMALLIDELQHCIPRAWLLQNLTIFADDITVHCLFQDTLELTQALQYFEHIIATIERLGLKISPSKSSVITRGKGAGYEKWKKTHTRLDSNKTHVLVLPNSKMHIPLKKKQLYLGIMLSYDNFERQTVEVRVQAGWNNFKRLKPWLCRKHNISLRLRLELMRTCIIPTICYGILYTGLHENGIHLICQTLHQMYRRIIGNLPHQTRETHTTVLARHGVEPPLITLDKLATQAISSLTNALTQVSDDDVIHLTDWKTLHSTRSLLTSRLCHPEHISESDSASEEFACIYCAFVAPTKPELQRHLTLVHAQPRPLKRKVNYSQDTTNGMPQCAHCKKMFFKWSSFRAHCSANICGAPPVLSQISSHPSPLDLDWEDPVAMEPGPLHQEISDRAMVFAVEADYASVRGDRRLCDYLQHHCIICSRHISHPKALTAHMRSNHPAQLQEAIALGIQRMRQFTGNLSPCTYCLTSFNKTHLCPVFLQMGILELRAATPDDPLHFTCFLCQFVAADRAQLKKHLTTLHSFPCHDWTPARDGLEDQVTCAHCGSVHHCQQALRKHIIYGHCSQFDPARPWTRNGDADVVEQLTTGRIDLILADLEMKRRLTHNCQFCSQQFSQVSNLVGHLWQQHGELAEEGELYRQVLQQRFAPRGCSCVPRIKQFRSTHTCVLFHQLSMIHYNGNALFNIPVVYDDVARERMEEHVPLRLLLLMHDALKTRDFELLQQDSKFRELLRQQCLCCGKAVTLTGPAKEHVLRHHLQTMHPEPQQAIQCLTQMVIHRKGHDHLTTCDWCGVTIVPTTPHNEYDEHLAECPVLQHFVTWLLIPLTSSSHGSRAGGHGNTDQGCAGNAGGLRGSKRPLSEETKKEPAGGCTIKEAFSRQRRRESSQDAIPDVPAGLEARAGPELPSSTKHLHPIHVDGEGRPDDPDTATKQQLETVATTAPSDSVPTTMPGAQCDADSGSKGHKSDGMQEGGSTVAIESSKQVDTTGCIMALPQVGPQVEILGGRYEDEQPSNEGPTADVGTDLQAPGKTRSGREVPCSSEQEQRSASGAMAVGTRHEGSQATQSPALLGELQCLAIGANQIETSPPAAIQAGRRPYEAQQEKIDLSMYCHILRELVLVNDDVQCYVNATFLTIMWTHLMCGDFNMGSWEDATAIFLAVLKDGETQPLCLRNHSMLQSGFRQWQQLRGERSTTQQDYGEFLHYLLEWIHSRHVVLTTSRRFLRASEVVTAEKSDAASPILLHSDLWEQMAKPVQFQHVLDQWHLSNGMLQAVEQASHILCCQICRFHDVNTIDRTVIEFGNLRVVIPCFTDARLSIARIPYQVTALVHYTGNARGGHYNCVVAFLDRYGDLKWLFHDDNCKPVVWNMLPEWFLYDVTHVWMVRCDKFHQWKQQMPDTSSQEAALANVLAQFRAS